MRKLEFGEESPYVPEGASAYERQEINRYWRNAHHHLREAALRADEYATELEDGASLTAGLGLANASMRLTQAAAAYEGLQVAINAVIHRQALLEGRS